jgi:hypothetical protein
MILVTVNNTLSKVKTWKLILKFIILLITVNYQLSTINCFSQGVSINTTGVPADNSSILDISSSSQGLLMPRLTLEQRNNITFPALSLLIFNTTTNCFEAYVNGIWYSVSCPPCTLPSTPASGINIPSQTQIIWNWATVSGATGYKWNTINNYATATDNLSVTSFTQTGFSCGTTNILYVWAYNACGNSSYTKLTQATSNCECGGSGNIITIAGNGTYNYNGDGIAATAAELRYPAGVAVDGSGNVYIVEYSDSKIRKIDHSTGLISTIAGLGGLTGGYNGDNIPATSAQLNLPWSIALDNYGNIYITDAGNSRVRKITASTGIISTIAGNGVNGYNGDGIPATSAQLYNPWGVAVDRFGNVYIADGINSRIRKVTYSTGLISTIAGTSTFGYNGDGIPATNAQLRYPYGVAVDGSGNVYIGDNGNQMIRKVSNSTGIISTIGNSKALSIALDSFSDLYIADGLNNIKKINISTGLISTIAGTNSYGYNGDRIPATNAELYYPSGIFVDSSGNIYIGDEFNNRIRKVCY